MPLQQLHFSHIKFPTVLALNYTLSADGSQFDWQDRFFFILGPIAMPSGFAGLTRYFRPGRKAQIMKTTKPVLRSFIPFRLAFPSFKFTKKRSGKNYLAAVEILDTYFGDLDNNIMRLQVVWNFLHALNVNGSFLAYQNLEEFKKQIENYFHLIRSLLITEPTLEAAAHNAVEKNWLNDKFLPAVVQMFAKIYDLCPESRAYEAMVNAELRTLKPLINAHPGKNLIAPVLDVTPMKLGKKAGGGRVSQSEIEKQIQAAIKEAGIVSEQVAVNKVMLALHGIYGAKIGAEFKSHEQRRLQCQIVARQRKSDELNQSYLKRKYFSDLGNVKNEMLMLIKISHNVIEKIGSRMASMPVQTAAATLSIATAATAATGSAAEEADGDDWDDLDWDDADGNDEEWSDEDET